jgi:hypothetical protein
VVGVTGTVDTFDHRIGVLDGDEFTTPILLSTGKGAHGRYPSRDSERLYISNRRAGSISLLEFATSFRGPPPPRLL